MDLREAIELLKKDNNQLIETDILVDPNAELSGVYRHVGAGGTVMRPTKIDGPAMIFNKVKGHENARVIIGLLASRERVAKLLGTKKEDLGKLLCDAALNPIEPVVSREKAPCQEVIHRATDEDFDLFKLIPAPTNTPQDAGPYITMGMCYATHPDTGLSDVTTGLVRSPTYRYGTEIILEQLEAKKCCCVMDAKYSGWNEKKKCYKLPGNMDIYKQFFYRSRCFVSTNRRDKRTSVSTIF